MNSYCDLPFNGRPKKRKAQEKFYRAIGSFLGPEKVSAMGLCNKFPIEIAESMTDSGINLSQYHGFELDPNVQTGALISNYKPNRLSAEVWLHRSNLWQGGLSLLNKDPNDIRIFDLDFCDNVILREALANGDLSKLFQAATDGKLALIFTYSPRRFTSDKMHQQIMQCLQEYGKVSDTALEVYRDISPMHARLYLVE